MLVSGSYSFLEDLSYFTITYLTFLSWYLLTVLKILPLHHMKSASLMSTSMPAYNSATFPSPPNSFLCFWYYLNLFNLSLYYFQSSF